MMPPDRKSWTWWKATTVAGLVAASAGGGIMLFDQPSPTRWLLGLNLLVVGAVALLVSAIGAWLADTSPVAGPAVKAPPARLIFVVRRDRRDLYEQLQAMLGRQENVQVIIDRRDRPRDAFDREVVRRGWSVARVAS